MVKQLKAFGNIFVKSFKKWKGEDPLRQSAVIAYFAIFSIPALLVLVFNFASIFIEKQTIIKEVSRQIGSSISPGAADQIKKAVDRAGQLKDGTVSTVIGIIIILFGATRVFIHLKKTLNSIWEVEEKKESFLKMLKNSLFSIGLILSIGFLLLVSMVISTVLAAASHMLQEVFVKQIVYLFYALEFLVSLSVISLLFALIFKFLPDVRIKWRNVLPGALLTGFLFMLLKYAISFYFARAEPASLYGTAGSMVLIMLWVAFSSMVLFFGAEFTRQYAVYHHIPVTKKNKDHAEKINQPDERTDSD